MLKNKLDIDRWNPKNALGYQRIPTESRYKKFGKFVAQTKGVSPISILISLRDKDALDVYPIRGGNGAVGLTIYPDGGKMYIPDGQHRAYGLRWAVDEYPGEVEEYELPVVLFVADGDDPRYEEAVQFYTINNFSKRVRTDLAQRYVLRQREKDLGKLSDKVVVPGGVPWKQLEPFAVKITDIVNSDGPLKGKINPPNVSITAASISQGSFVDSLRPLLTKAAEAGWDIGKTAAVLNAYWGAVKNKCPEAFSHWSGDACTDQDDDHFNAVLVTTSGMYSLNDVLARSLLRARVLKAPTTPETFRSLLDEQALEDYFTDGEDGYWSSQEGATGAAAHGTGRKSFKEIADEIWDNIPED